MATPTGLHYSTATKWELSPRQREVLDLVARGRTNAQIGDALGITLDGAKFHVGEIIGKLGVGNREEAAEWWRDYNRPTARIRRALAPAFSFPLWRIAGAGLAVVAAGAVAIVAIATLQSGDDDALDAPAAAVADTAAEPFVPGAFTVQVGQALLELDLRPDGTFNLSGSGIFQGSYIVEEDRFIIDDRAFGSICESPEPAPGSYTWARSADGALVLSAVDEPCEARGRLWGRTWRAR